MNRCIKKKKKLIINYIYKNDSKEPSLIDVLKEGYLNYVKNL